MPHTRHGNTVWIASRLAVYARDGFACVYCERAGRWRPGRRARLTNLQIDHVDPALGFSPENVVTACCRCNALKSDRPVEAFRPDRLDAVLCALATPLDRALGRALARELAPHRLATKRTADAAQRRRTTHLRQGTTAA